MVILGVDPGLNATGFGVIRAQPAAIRVLAAGSLKPPRARPLAERLEVIHRGLSDIIQQYQPGTVVLEQLFTHADYVATATLMGHARGVCCLAAQEHGVPMAEYPPARAKKALTGTGQATKQQVARMVAQWLGIADPGWSADATDALALAIVHAQLARQRERLPDAKAIAAGT